MDYGTHRTAPSWWPATLSLAFALVATTAAYLGQPLLRIGEAAAVVPTQDVTRIESRLSLLEQRFYSIEASLRGLEQQSRLSGVTSGSAARDPEVGLLRAEVEALRRRLAEVECGLTRVDERTLSPAAKEARRRSGNLVIDPCRLNPDAPLRPATRP